MPTTLGDRIKKALADADMTVQALADTLEEEGVEGGSYANLHRLKSDKMERPSAGLLYGIAKATGVRLPWLIAGDEPATEEVAAVGGITAKTVDDLDSSDELEGFIAAAEGGRDWKASVWLKYRTLNALGVDGPDLSPADPETLKERLDAFARGRNIRHIPHWVPLVAEARRRLDVDPVAIGEALRGPLTALDLDADAMTSEELGDYISAMIPVLLTLESHHEQEDDHATE